VKVKLQEQDGCLVVVSHALNQDGYARMMCHNGYERLTMYHRHVWRECFGEIPDRYEVDHICRNRACCNPEHLQLLECSEHKAKGNALRYLHIKEKAREIWLSDKTVTGTYLSQMFGKSVSTGCKWVRMFKKEILDSLRTKD